MVEFSWLIKNIKIKDSRGIVREYCDSPSYNDQEASYSVIMGFLTAIKRQL
jgi:hypothetical protein